MTVGRLAKIVISNIQEMNIKLKENNLYSMTIVCDIRDCEANKTIKGCELKSEGVKMSPMELFQNEYSDYVSNIPIITNLELETTFEIIPYEGENGERMFCEIRKLDGGGFE
jgi:hypothetical protein